MTNLKKDKPRKKMPLSIILIIIWMSLAVIGLAFNLISMRQLSLSRQLLGDTFAFIDYGIDWLIVVAFSIFIITFIRRTKNVWRPFVWFILFLIVGEMIKTTYGLLFIDRAIAVLNLNFPFALSHSTFIILSSISFLYNIAFYIIVIYFVKKHQSFFENDTN